MSLKLGTCLLFGVMLFLSGVTVSQNVLAAPEFSLEFGSFGISDGDFKSPSGLAFDASTNYLYVADTENDRIQIIDVDGDCKSSDSEHLEEKICFVDKFGNFGAEEGEFDSPKALAIDSDNDLLYIADTGNHRIQIIDVKGTCNDELADRICFGKEFGGFGDGTGKFDSPSGLTLDTSTDLLYIADTNNDRIQIIDVDGDCKSSDSEYLANRVCFVEEFGTEGNGNGKFNSPSGLTLDTSTDLLYIADTNNDRIQIIDVDGTCPSSDKLADGICFEDEFGDDGTKDGEFRLPSGLTLDTSTDLLYIADTDNERIQIIDVDGSCGSGDSDYLAKGICFEDEFGENGTKDGEFRELSAVILNEDKDEILVADSGNNRIQIIELSGSSGGSSSGAPSKPSGLKASPISKTSIFLSWDVSDSDDKVTGYKIESREGAGTWQTIVANTGSNGNTFVHGGLSDERYQYRISAINSQGTSSTSSVISEEPEDSAAPSAFTATAISPSKIKLSWFPPTSTFGQSISGYVVERVITDGVYDEIDTTGRGTTTYTVSNLQTDKEYSYVVSATLTIGSTPRSDTATATPKDDSYEPTSSSISLPGAPKLTVKVISGSQIDLSWNKPSDGGSSISGYKIEFKEGDESYDVIDDNSGTATTYSHTDLTPDKKYTYKVSAINGVGVGSSSNEASGVPTDAPTEVLEIKPLGSFATNEEKRLTFIVGTTQSIDNVSYSLGSNAPIGASIGRTSGSFSWTPNNTQSGTYTFDIVAKSGSMQDTESITITVNNIADKEPEQPTEPEPPTEPTSPKELGIASFVDQTKDPQHYVDRYNNEPTYKEWFDDNFPEYDSIYEAVGLEEPKGLASFVDPNKDPQHYVDRYNNEPNYKEWFDDNFPEYDSIYEAVGLEEPKVEEPTVGNCGEGTELVNGVCTLVDEPRGGGCLIATATYGSELAPQVQFLREIRDNKVMSTESGSSFMSGFNQIYYSFSPAIADYERENPLFKEVVKIGITPMLSSLSILPIADVNSEEEMLGYGIAIIMANIGMYFVAPALVVYRIKKLKLARF